MCATNQIVVSQATFLEFPAIRDLIVRGLSERWTQYNASFNPDLEAFGEFYADAFVLVAKDNNTIVGCGILLKETELTGRIVRMSVLADCQRTGIGSKILIVLLERAKSLGYKEVVLETTATWESAVRFYRGHGFIPTTVRDGDQHFRLAFEGT